uniref:Uncharacterized protein n=1 Tax=Rhizoctonia cerealis orthocurvulavirus TaxID=3068670 RepID=A0AA51BS77_9VIRU|nr:MAG: hypothetical protein [Rhizoctonia cerealis orthocurvulavirus]WMI40018.1 MAG: hypothetical protein [Rhizoctonia cerealis orthocurvulavirus]
MSPEEELRGLMESVTEEGSLVWESSLAEGTASTMGGVSGWSATQYSLALSKQKVGSPEWIGNLVSLLRLRAGNGQSSTKWKNLGASVISWLVEVGRPDLADVIKLAAQRSTLWQGAIARRGVLYGLIADGIEDQEAKENFRAMASSFSSS